MRLALILAIVLAGASAHADPAMMSAEARAHFDRGRELYDAGSYADAIGELAKGRELDPHPDFLYAIAQAYRKLGDCTHAIAHYDAFLATHPPEAEAARVRANVARCPVAPTMATTPSEHREIASLHAGASRRPFYTDPAGDLLAGGGLAGLGAGVTYLVLGERDARAANEAPTIARLQQLSASAGRERAIGAILTIAGGAFTAGAIVRYWFVSRRDPAVTIAVTPGSISAVWSRSF